ncbi:conjugative transfer protein MobI(A/C) [Gilvimarinus agarilyticus]|uniref:conjugative transfer protein MobI(A/C) n=1 Tax=Gilvimarinus agarilyticus TaxID=679259 RepID=UPI0005A23BE5|nr:conjugative transfer protein MobI(A/C) [Gilvimarinus agarilyticus]
MKIDTETDVLDLLQPGCISERMLIGSDQIKQNGARFCEEMTKRLNLEIYRTALEAQKAADWYWMENQAERENPGSETCYIGTRVKLNRGSVQLMWYRNRTVPVDKAKPSGPRKVMSTYIQTKSSRKAGPQHYDMRTFKNEPGWAKEVIEKVEEIYRRVRKRIYRLQESKRHIKQYRLMLEQELNEQKYHEQ